MTRQALRARWREERRAWRTGGWWVERERPEGGLPRRELVGATRHVESFHDWAVRTGRRPADFQERIRAARAGLAMSPTSTRMEGSAARRLIAGAAAQGVFDQRFHERRLARIRAAAEARVGRRAT